MHVVAANMCSEELPVPKDANFDDRFEDDGSAKLVELGCSLSHRSPVEPRPLTIVGGSSWPEDIVIAVDAALGIAVVTFAVTGEGDQVRRRDGAVGTFGSFYDGNNVSSG